MNYEDYYDDYYGEEGGFIKNKGHKKKKFKGKGHQSRKSESERWSEILEADDDFEESYRPCVVKDRPLPTNDGHPYRRGFGGDSAPAQTWKPRGEHKPSEPRKFVANPETTKNVKGVDIDFGGVVAMAKEDSDAKGYKTYGIRFTFKGSKGLYRIVWFNKNQFLRDKIFDEKKAYWDSLQNNPGSGQ